MKEQLTELPFLTWLPLPLSRNEPEGYRGEFGMKGSQQDRLNSSADVMAFDAIIIAMLARLQRLDPAVRVLLSQILEDAAKFVEARATEFSGNRRELLSALNKIENIREIALAVAAEVPDSDDFGKANSKETLSITH
ncbi:hypothetical protein [Allomesorhizobium camelthorni]|uniref:Uncharacterized protein n=1 Tax=Allomesorhizobium camelthorni TaxID=475069 RepID=A0A6G4W8M3_9HYPH|nr:hypothetical protein [Mesorhizobium camelthorni]NGO51115.1 hypothetical protein [Mesorhizobium camelthorni]